MRQVVPLAIAAALLILAPALAAAEGDSAKPTILVDNGTITINGTQLAMPCRTADIVAALGKPDRMLLDKDFGGTVEGTTDQIDQAAELIWDDLGISAGRTHKQVVVGSGLFADHEWRYADPVRYLMIQLTKSSYVYDYDPQQTFPGTLRLGGVPLADSTTIDQLKQPLADWPFEEHPDVKGLYDVLLSRMHVKLSPAGDKSQQEGANFSALRITPKDKANVLIDDGNLSIDGASLSMPCQEADLVAVLGPPDRELDLYGKEITDKDRRPYACSLVWDAIGISAVRASEWSDTEKKYHYSDPIEKIKVVVDPGVNSADWPLKAISGKLAVDGVKITYFTPIDEINQQHADRPFTKPDDSSAWYFTTYENGLKVGLLEDSESVTERNLSRMRMLSITRNK